MIVDCFPLFNELDLLEIRLTELYDVVDLFVLVEATHTHSGQPKPLHYGINRQRYARWFDKIRHIVVADLPDTGGDTAPTNLPATRRREMTQRQRILDGLRDIPDDAIVMISDLDEIPRRESVQRLAGGLQDGMVVAFIQKLFYYNVNTYAPDRPWPGTRAARAADVRALTPHVIRNGLAQPDAHYPIYARLDNAGWHLSYLGDVAHIQNKMRSFLHQELVNEENLDADTITRRMAEGLDIWGRVAEQSFTIGPASDIPAAIRCNPIQWQHLFHPDWLPTFHEDWYVGEQARFVGELARTAPQGALVEIGCWEGRSTVAIAQSVFPRSLHCVDHWRGNEDEGDGESIRLAKERNVFAFWLENTQRLAAGNISASRMSWQEWIADWQEPIGFLHLDASHDYDSVHDCLQAIKPFLVKGAHLCGDDGYSDGVYRAVRDVFGSEAVREIGDRLWVVIWEGDG